MNYSQIIDKFVHLRVNVQRNHVNYTVTDEVENAILASITASLNPDDPRRIDLEGWTRRTLHSGEIAEIRRRIKSTFPKAELPSGLI